MKKHYIQINDLFKINQNKFKIDNLYKVNSTKNLTLKDLKQIQNNIEIYECAQLGSAATQLKINQ